MSSSNAIRAPFPWPGGKARVADLVWSRLGNVDNYVEPFMGSLAVLLRRPADHFKGGYRVETANDLNHFVVNFWRAVTADPEQVAKWADWPVTECDLHARHKWLMRSQHAEDYRRRMVEDAEHYDAKVAGWWVWGQCCWIGGAWCNDVRTDYTQLPGINSDGKGYGVTRGGDAPTDWQQVTRLDAVGVLSTDGIPAGGPTDWVQPPDITSGGVDAHSAAGGRPQLADAYDIGRGVNSNAALSQKLPLLSGTGDSVYAIPGAGACSARRAWLTDWMRRLADRLRLVRTCYGNWSRVCDSESTLTRLGTTGVFLDPPYPANRGDTGKKSRDASLYATDNGADLDALRDEVLAWCRKWGNDSGVRVAVCCYEGDGYEPLAAEGWSVESWEANGGYGNQRRKGKGKSDNAKRERIYFSPACLTERTLFDDLTEGTA